MKITRIAAIVLSATLLGACGARTAAITIPDEGFDAEAPTRRPLAQSIHARLIPYPDLEIAYVANAADDTYHFRGIFYTYFDSSWFYARSLRGPWRFLEMKHAPSELFQVRGTRPASVGAPKVRLVSGDS